MASIQGGAPSAQFGSAHHVKRKKHNPADQGAGAPQFSGGGAQSLLGSSGASGSGGSGGASDTSKLNLMA